MEMAMTKATTVRDGVVKATTMKDEVMMTVRDGVVKATTMKDEVMMMMTTTTNVTQDLSDLMMTTVI
jgi:hypothetical protein